MAIHRAEVLSVERLGVGMLRLVLGGPGLVGYRSTGVGDEYLRLFLPHEDGTLQLPVATDTAWIWPEGCRPATVRTFTVREHHADAGELVIDVGLHAHGPAVTWALAARPGDALGINTPTALYDAPSGIDWQLLLADVSGLPAAVRLAEQAAPGVRTRLVLEVPDASHRLPLAPSAEITWLAGGNGVAPSRLADVLRAAILPDGPGYVWVAGEMRVMRQVRAHLRTELGLPGSAYKVVAYWAEGSEDWNARYERLDAAVRAQLNAIWESDRDEAEMAAEYDARLVALGL